MNMTSEMTRMTPSDHNEVPRIGFIKTRIAISQTVRRPWGIRRHDSNRRLPHWRRCLPSDRSITWLLVSRSPDKLSLETLTIIIANYGLLPWERPAIAGNGWERWQEEVFNIDETDHNRHVCIITRVIILKKWDHRTLILFFMQSFWLSDSRG